MAKKTNKTDHVLNLLAGAAKTDEVEQENSKAQPPVDPLEQMKSKVSVHHTSENGEAVIADAVKQSLEQEIMEAETEEPAPQKKTVKKQPDVPKESAKEVVTEPVAESEKEEPVEELKDEPKKEEPKEEEPKKEETAERTFEFVNVMERLVRDKVVGYMKQFGNCTCDRCIEDTTALSLSHLPAKCVVVNKEAVSPLLNFYTSKYAGQITVEITKSCIIVKNNPNH